MITPRFTLHQDDTFLKIEIRAPYCNLGELEVDCDENKFYFYCKPYYLRLDLPGEIVNDDRMKVVFDTDTGKFTCTFAKLNKCEHFDDLDLITKFLALGLETGDKGHGTMPVEPLSNGKQEDIADDAVIMGKSQYGFGFALRADRDFMRISSEFNNIFEIDPCKTSLPERRKLRLQYEQGKFNVDHYLADYCDNSDILELISLKCPYKDTQNNTFLNFSDEDYDFLKNLSNVEYNLSKYQIKICHNGLLDILFAFCYGERATAFEGNVEFEWTITKLAATLGWLDAFEDTKDVFISAFRRGLIYPLYRHFDLLQVVFDDLKALISLDENCLVKILIKIYNIFLNGGNGGYVLNNLFIKDYIVYIMKWDKEMWRTTVSDVKSMNIKKEELGLNLEEIEEDHAYFQKLDLRADTSTDSDEDTSSDESTDSSSSEYSSDSETTTDEGEMPKEISKFIVIQK
ncbi:unnamed protein product [Ceutorhynchus assimilis]|uniref:Protein SHQ1 homolog n=1 Tax=Ceutorhynchus assimilis TaxID=467358 RepID=A0A9N9M856_9CUCU|nr:unnamed protein product [Ceutorhynchus assimilis]